MAVNPALIKAAVQVLSTKEGRKGILIAVLIPVILALIIICLFAYILSAPINFLGNKFGLSKEESASIQNAQFLYKDYIKPENKVIDRGGFFPYPSDGTTGSRGFSATPVPHPVLGISRPHLGQDFDSEWHSNVYSIADGQVVDMGANEEAGLYVTIYHDSLKPERKFFTRYIHLSSIHTFPDAEVKAGDVIASEGGEPNKNDGKPFDYYPGTSTGHHLHFEVREGSSYNSAEPVDPKLYIDPIPVKIRCTFSDCSDYGVYDGRITVYLTGGRERGFDISLNGGLTWITTPEGKIEKFTFNNLPPGRYQVIARDASWIENISDKSYVTIRMPPPPPPPPPPNYD